MRLGMCWCLFGWCVYVCVYFTLIGAFQLIFIVLVYPSTHTHTHTHIPSTLTSLSVLPDWDDIPRQFVSSSAEWVDEPEAASYVKCHQPCPTADTSTNATTDICISQMERTIRSQGAVLPPDGQNANRTENGTAARSGTSGVRRAWTSALCAGALLASYHRVIGLT